MHQPPLTPSRSYFFDKRDEPSNGLSASAAELRGSVGFQGRVRGWTEDGSGAAAVGAAAAKEQPAAKAKEAQTGSGPKGEGQQRVLRRGGEDRWGAQQEA